METGHTVGPKTKKYKYMYLEVYLETKTKIYDNLFATMTF